MMVVLIIIGIIVSSVVLSIKTDDIEEHMEMEMRRIQTLLNLARDEAVLQGHEMALTVAENRYLFEILVNNRWEPITDDKIFRERAVVPGTELALVVDDLEISFANKQFDLSVGDDDEKEKKDEDRPRVFILSSGEIMPFELILRTEDQTIEYRVRVEENGQPEVLLPQDLG